MSAWVGRESKVSDVHYRPVGLAHFRGQDASGKRLNTGVNRLRKQADFGIPLL